MKRPGEQRLRVAGLLAAGLVSSAGISAAAFGNQLPLPPDAAKSLSDPNQIMMGGTALEVQRYRTQMTPEAVRRFYETALPKAGWRIAPLPWQAAQAKAIARLEQGMQEEPEAAGTPEVVERLATLQDTAQDMRRQLYAVKGRDHVIVNLWPREEETLVFLNQWTGQAQWMEPLTEERGGAPREAAAARWPAANVCCSNEGVPSGTKPLPAGIPSYPGARTLTLSASADGGSGNAVLASADRPEQVAAYYRKHMAYHGWTLDATPVSAQTAEAMAGAEVQTFSYRTEQHLCGMTISRPSAEGGPRPDPRGSRDGPEAQTLIMVTVVSNPVHDMKRLQEAR